MKFTLKETVPFPRDRVYATQRDRLSELAPYLNDIKEIEVKSREENGTVVRFVNLWKAKGGDVPTIAKAFIKPEMLQWLDHAMWDASKHECEWRIELGFLPGAIEARGRNTWTELGPNQTLCTINGEIIVNAGKIPGVPMLLAGKLGPAVEQFVVKTIEPNLKKTVEGVARFLREHG